MDDIATEAGINRALLHYYFRSKQKLFDVIFEENLSRFYRSFIEILSSELDLESKIRNLISAEIDIFARKSGFAFIYYQWSQPQSGNDGWKMTHLPVKQFVMQFSQIIHEEITKGNIKPINPIHILMHIMSLCIFPFVGRPVFTAITGTGSEQFNLLMEDRKNNYRISYPIV